MAKSCMNVSSSVGKDNTFGDKKEKLEREKEREEKNCVELFSALVCHRKSKFLFISRVLVHF